MLLAMMSLNTYAQLTPSTANSYRAKKKATSEDGLMYSFPVTLLPKTTKVVARVCSQ